MKKYTLVITSGCLFSNNMGCNALTYGILEVLSKVAIKLGVEFEYWLFGNPKGGNVPPELQEYDIKIFGTLPHRSYRDYLSGAYHKDLKKRLAVGTALKKADLFLDNGAGDSFSDIYGHARLNSILRNMLMASSLKKPFIFLPQTVGPFSDISSAQAQFIRKVLTSAEGVYTRDPKSTACVHSVVQGVEVFESVDVALFMNYAQRIKSGPSRFSVGINPSGLLWRGGYTGKNEFGLKVDYQKTLRDLIEYLLSKGFDVEFVGHDISGPHGGVRCDDYYVCKQLQREYPKCSVGPFFYGPSEAKSYISGYDLLIGSRMHCCIAAYSAEVPVLPLGYSRKFTGLFGESLNYPYLVDLTAEDDSTVFERLNALLGNNKVVKSELQGVRKRQIKDWEVEFVNHLSIKLKKALAL